MAKLDVTLDDVKAIAMIQMALDKAIFPMIEGSEINNLASSRVRLSSLRFKLDKYLKELDAETAEEMAKKLETPATPKEPVKKDK